jgi:hypothetical protein
MRDSGGDLMTLVDGHVHVHSHVGAGAALDIAERNFRRVSGRDGGWTGVLLVADPPGVEFAAVVRNAASSAAGVVGDWTLQVTGEACSFVARRGDRALILILGHQLATAERLEVLSFGAAEAIPNRLSIDQTLAAIARSGGVGIVPWGLGKWGGDRGRIVERVLAERRGAKLFLGDNGGRPKGWPVPHFELARRLNVPVLRGTDPLPVAGDEHRIGTFGFGLTRQIPFANPLESLIETLGDSATVLAPLGHSASLARAVSNQFRLRLMPVAHA